MFFESLQTNQNSMYYYWNIVFIYFGMILFVSGAADPWVLYTVMEKPGKENSFFI